MCGPLLTVTQQHKFSKCRAVPCDAEKSITTPRLSRKPQQLTERGFHILSRCLAPNLTLVLSWRRLCCSVANCSTCPMTSEPEMRDLIYHSFMLIEEQKLSCAKFPDPHTLKVVELANRVHICSGSLFISYQGSASLEVMLPALHDLLSN